MAEPRWETVPKDTPVSVCKGHRRPGGTCRAPIYWVERPKLRQGVPVPGQTARVPVDCSIAGGQEPDSLSPGRGVSHFTVCPDAENF